MAKRTFETADEDSDLHDARPSIIVANLTGGIGKTTIARGLAYIWKAAGQPLSLVSVDSVDDASVSKLASLGDEVEQMTIGANAAKVGRDKFGDAQVEHWSPMGDHLGKGGHLIDFGANAIPALLDWAVESKPRFLLEDAPLLTFVVPVTSIAQSASDGLLVLKRIFEAEPHFMKLRVVVAFNAKYGSVAAADGPAFVALRAFMKTKAIASFEIPNGTIKLAEEYTFLDLATVHPRTFGARVGISPMLANTRLRFFTNWLEAFVKNAEAVGLGPKKIEGTKAA
ncbi:MAG: hypothetical protein ACRYGP_32905 [Janthinobacterium lividum]